MLLKCVFIFAQKEANLLRSRQRANGLFTAANETGNSFLNAGAAVRSCSQIIEMLAFSKYNETRGRLTYCPQSLRKTT